jgi:hypothetical protein
MMNPSLIFLSVSICRYPYVRRLFIANRYIAILGATTDITWSSTTSYITGDDDFCAVRIR